MPQKNCRAVQWVLWCVAASLLAGCSLITPDWTPRRRQAANECPFEYMHYCTTSNWGTRCGCMAKQDMEKVLRSRQ
jgi:hypothetical protein